MHLDRMDLNLFVVFDAIYSERNLTRAAEKLNVTQPAISNALKRMRETFNDPLFTRTPEGMMPTAVADNIIAKVQQALLLLSSSIKEYDQFKPAESDKTFRIAMGDMAEILFLPTLLQRLQQQAPSVKLRSFYLEPDEVPLELANGGIDLAINAPLLADHQLESAALLNDDYVCVLRKDHPLSNRKLTLEKYLSLSHLHLSSRRRGIGQVDQALKVLGLRRHITLRAQHYLMALPIIEQTDLALSIPASLASRQGLKARPLPFEVPQVPLRLFWHKNADHDPANRWLRNLLIAGVKETVK